MARSAAQLRFLFGPGGPFYRHVAGALKRTGLDQHATVEGHRAILTPANPDEVQRSINESSQFQDALASSKPLHPGASGGWRERRNWQSLHITRHGPAFDAHVDRGNPQGHIGAKLVHAAETIGIPGLKIAAGAALAARAAGQHKTRRDAVLLRKAMRDQRRWSTGAGVDSMSEVKTAAAAAAAHPGPITRPLRAVLHGDRQANGFRSMQYRFVDQAGKHVGGAGATLDGKGRAWVGGTGDKAMWSFVPVKPGETQAMVEQLKQDAPGVRSVIGATPGRVKRANLKLAEIGRVAGEKTASAEAFRAKGGLWRKIIADGRVMAAKQEQAQATLAAAKGLPASLAMGGKAPKFSGQDVLAYQGGSLSGLPGGRVLINKEKADRNFGRGLMIAGAADYGYRYLKARNRSLEMRGKYTQARRERFAEKAIGGGIAGFALYKSLKRGLRAGIALGRAARAK